MRLRIGWPAGFVCAVFASGFAAGCDSTSPETRLEGAGRELDAARAELDAARERRSEAQQALREARKAVRRAESQVLSAEERVSRRASEVALFRAVQSALLEDPALREAALAAHVENSTVTLEGEVSKVATRERALELARSTPGVLQVRDEIDVVDASGG